MNDEKSLIQALIEAGRDAEALQRLKSCPGYDTDAELRLKAGKLLWRLGMRAEAISEYEHALALDAGSPARLLLEQSREIMNFYHRDLYNP